MKLLLCIIPLLLVAGMSSASADIGIKSDYYKTGDFLEIAGYLHDDDVTITIDGDNYHKSYSAEWNGYQGYGFPLTGFESGFYNVTISYNDNIKIQQFGLNKIIPAFTLYAESNIIPLNEYAFFFGQVVGIEPKDYSFNGNVLIQVLDMNGNLVEDNWKSDKDTAKSVNSASKATKSEFRALINNGKTFLTTQNDANIFGDQGAKSIRPVLENGYRAYVKIDSTIYDPWNAYTLRVTHDGLIREKIFMVTDYNNSYFIENEVCTGEKKNYDHLIEMQNNFKDIESLHDKYTMLISNFKYSSGCEQQ